MSWNDIKASVYASCGALLEPHGFRLIKSRSSYEKVTANGRLMIYFTLVASDVGNRFVRTGCGVRNNAIEDLFHKTSSTDKRCQSATATIGVSCDKLWVLNTTEEVAIAISELNAYVRDVALPFLQKKYSLQDFSMLLNTTNTDGRCPYFANSIWRCHRGLIAELINPFYFQKFLYSLNLGY